MTPDPDKGCTQVRILHMDEKPVLSGYLESLPDANHFSIAFCTSEQEARELLKNESFDIIVAEHRPPGMDALALLRDACLISPSLPFIFFTDSRDENLPIDALNGGADHYLRKSGDRESVSRNLRETICRTFEKRNAARDLEESERRLQDTPADALYVMQIKRAEETLRKANKKLTYLSSVTRHDILNQVAVLVGYLELLGEDLQDRPGVTDVLKIIETATRKIEQQITFTRDYEELGTKEPAWQNIGDVTRNALRYQKLEGADVSVATGTLEVYADPMLGKVFSNLFDNVVRHAGKFTEITVSFRKEGEEGIVTVEDNGVGVPDAIKERIFARGYGSHTGFGLFLVREILDVTGISIRETGEAGKGARFEIRLPADTWRC